MLNDCKIKLELDKSISDKIKFLCKHISTVEWSGVLFYDVVGTIADPTNMVIHLREIFLMDKGTAGHTAYNYDEELVGFRMDNPTTNFMKIGHIHSHNSMGVFFSGEDTSELTDNADFHNYYVSVVVNNRFEVIGRVAFIGINGNAVITGKNEDGETYTRPVTGTEKVMFYYDCQVAKDDYILEVPDAFAARMKEVIKKADAKPVTTPKPSGAGTGQGYWLNNVWHPSPNGQNAPNLKKEYGQQEPKRYINQDVLFDQEDDQTNQEEDDTAALYREMEDFLVEVISSYPEITHDLQLNDEELVILDDAFYFLKGRIGKAKREAFFEFMFQAIPNMYETNFVSEKYTKEDNYEDDLLIMAELLDGLKTDYVNANYMQGMLLGMIQKIRDNADERLVNKV